MSGWEKKKKKEYGTLKLPTETNNIELLSKILFGWITQSIM